MADMFTDVEVLQREIECVKRKTAINCNDCFNCDLIMPDTRILEAFNNAIEALKRTKVVTEVTRCKDCEKSRNWGEEDTLLCYRDKSTIHIVKPDSYCDKGQRRLAVDAPEVLKFEPVVHGNWLDANDIRKSKCSNCKVEFGRVMGDDCYYCPSCGARMELESVIENEDL